MSSIVRKTNSAVKAAFMELQESVDVRCITEMQPQDRKCNKNSVSSNVSSADKTENAHVQSGVRDMIWQVPLASRVPYVVLVNRVRVFLLIQWS
jgi:hypothetical protein